VEKKQKLKNWVIAVNSIHDVHPADSSSEAANAAAVWDNDDSISVKPAADNTSTSGDWPQAWVDPGGWRPLMKNNASSIKFNQKVSFMRYQNVPPQPSVLYGVTVSDNLSTPYGRYEISKNIMDILKDPKKKEQVDLQDPLVKAVYEAVLIEDQDDLEEYQEEAPVQKLSKVLDQGEFVPFNPLVSRTISYSYAFYTS